MNMGLMKFTQPTAATDIALWRGNKIKDKIKPFYAVIYYDEYYAAGGDLDIDSLHDVLSEAKKRYQQILAEKMKPEDHIFNLRIVEFPSLKWLKAVHVYDGEIEEKEDE